jgi:hypothetical protein
MDLLRGSGAVHGLSHTSLWRRVSNGELKAARVGRSVRIHLPSLREFMDHASAN